MENVLSLAILAMAFPSVRLNTANITTIGPEKSDITTPETISSPNSIATTAQGTIVKTIKRTKEPATSKSKGLVLSTLQYNSHDDFNLTLNNRPTPVTDNFNSTTSKNSTDQSKPRRAQRRRSEMTSAQRKLTIGLFSVIAIVGIFGNFLVIYVYGFTARKRFLKFERLMLILGFVDFIASLTNPWLYIYQLAKNYAEWDFGEFGCKVLTSIGPISTSISLGIILIMSIDRDRAVVTPLNTQFTTRTIHKAVALNVVLATSTAIPYMSFLSIGNRGVCTVNSKLIYDYARYSLCYFAISDIVFVCVLGITTIRVFVKLSHGQIISHPKSKEFRKRETKRILKIIAAMGITFIVLIFPRDIYQILYLYKFLHPPLLKVEDPLFVNAVLKFLHTSNSSVNILLYSILNKRFRREVVRVFMKFKYLRKISGYQTTTDSTSLSESYRNGSRKESLRSRSSRIQRYDNKRSVVGDQSMKGRDARCGGGNVRVIVGTDEKEDEDVKNVIKEDKTNSEIEIEESQMLL